MLSLPALTSVKPLTANHQHANSNTTACLSCVQHAGRRANAPPPCPNRVNICILVWVKPFWFVVKDARQQMTESTHQHMRMSQQKAEKPNTPRRRFPPASHVFLRFDTTRPTGPKVPKHTGVFRMGNHPPLPRTGASIIKPRTRQTVGAYGNCYEYFLCHQSSPPKASETKQ